MKILEIVDLKIPEIKVFKYGRFADHRGYFTEHFRNSDFFGNKDLPFTSDEKFLQANESFSYKNTFRGLHFQWNPYMGKLVRPVTGSLIDFALDIRKNSPTLGKIVAYEMRVKRQDNFGEWIWIPPGFAHGIFLPEDSLVEYFCTGEYSQGCEAGISPLSKDIDWSFCNSEIKSVFDSIVPSSEFISEKDKNAHTLAGWLEDKNSDKFIYGNDFKI
jgi:dTDP-4-dehydrorhamnose 3,5-epimerase